jgi:3-deoxy-manno-octulosonate cytidylyltransferase (CMP-KDO synthetase)
MSCLIVIPARWGASRFPGKPLHSIAGKPLVRHVWERCRRSKRAAAVLIATDDERIAEAARGFGAEVAMTDPGHPSGTDRVAEAAALFPGHDSVINVQGDEPLISPKLIDSLAAALEADRGIRMITAAAPVHDPALMDDPNVVKVVLDNRGDALYFSRAPLPYFRNADPEVPRLRHLGIYGFQREFLMQFVSWPAAALERVEGLEQLRALAHGARIRVVLTGELSPGVDTPAQADEVEARILEMRRSGAAE